MGTTRLPLGPRNDDLQRHRPLAEEQLDRLLQVDRVQLDRAAREPREEARTGALRAHAATPSGLLVELNVDGEELLAEVPIQEAKEGVQQQPFLVCTRLGSDLGEH
jgi:hypothetical protein